MWKTRLNRWMKVGFKVADKLFSTSAAGLYMLLFAIAIGVATFIENDYGTSAAQKVVFKTRWFEALLVLFSLTLIANIIRFRFIPMKKWASLIFHASIVIIVLGAGVTRYYGYEGMMGIREGEASDTFLSADTHLVFDAIQGEKRYKLADDVLFASLGKNNYEESFLLGPDRIDVKLLNFTPNPIEKAEENELSGLPTLKIVMAGAGGREEYYIQEGSRTNIRGTLFNFSGVEMPGAFNIRFDPEARGLEFKSDQIFTQMVMATQQSDTLPSGNWHTLMLRSMYADGMHNFVFGDFLPKATVHVVSEKIKMDNSSFAALDLEIRINGQPQRVVISGGKGVEGRPKVVKGGSTSLAISYGARRIKVPFSIQLRDFILERYPGTDNPSSYASEVTVIDPPNNVKRDQRIYMNNILDYGGYRFFQSSFDPDELGTYLSVNHDFWGTWISYIGYALLTIGLVMTFFAKNSRFTQIAQQLKRMRNPTA